MKRYMCSRTHAQPHNSSDNSNKIRLINNRLWSRGDHSRNYWTKVIAIHTTWCLTSFRKTISLSNLNRSKSGKSRPVKSNCAISKRSTHFAIHSSSSKNKCARKCRTKSILCSKNFDQRRHQVVSQRKQGNQSSCSRFAL